MTTLQKKRAVQRRGVAPSGGLSTPERLADLEARMRKLPNRSVATLRRLRREISRELRALPGTQVLTLAETLVVEGRCSRWFAHELVHFHTEAASQLSAAWLNRLGKGNSEWHHVDPFATYLLGPAWRVGRVTDAEIARWARSQDHWRRRSALVATVALNNTARGGRGDTTRTLAVCDLLRSDREDMVVKAMSWALRELSRKDPKAVKQYIARYESELAPRVLREVRNKLGTGLKNPQKKRG
ncbi:MAG TPA: DNA alkylation repair protein [Polyangiales bacterium]|nr:DNA alkylation repair protein [Polyangiales bacterium]